MPLGNSHGEPQSPPQARPPTGATASLRPARRASCIMCERVCASLVPGSVRRACPPSLSGTQPAPRPLGLLPPLPRFASPELSAIPSQKLESQPFSSSAYSALPPFPRSPYGNAPNVEPESSVPGLMLGVWLGTHGPRGSRQSGTSPSRLRVAHEEGRPGSQEALWMIGGRLSSTVYRGCPAADSPWAG